jgi:hypothetical protein
LVCTLPLLHFSHFRVAVNSAVTFKEFQKPLRCHSPAS